MTQINRIAFPPIARPPVWVPQQPNRTLRERYVAVARIADGWVLGRRDHERKQRPPFSVLVEDVDTATALQRTVRSYISISYLGRHFRTRESGFAVRTRAYRPFRSESCIKVRPR